MAWFNETFCRKSKDSLTPFGHYNIVYIVYILTTQLAISINNSDDIVCPDYPRVTTRGPFFLGWINFNPSMDR